MKTSTMTRQHYEEIAEIINDIQDGVERDAAAYHFAKKLALRHSNFDLDKFEAACHKQW